jgi:hypothetical protein
MIKCSKILDHWEENMISPYLVSLCKNWMAKTHQAMYYVPWIYHIVGFYFLSQKDNLVFSFQAYQRV